MKFERLGNICTIRNGFAFNSDEFSDKGIPVVRISDLSNGIATADKAQRISFDAKYDRFKIIDGDILVAMSGATTGKFARFKSIEFAFQNQRVGCFIIKDRSVLNDGYLFFCLENLKKEIKKKAYGGAQPNISSGDIENLKIPLPSLPEQFRIANILSKAENLIAQRKESLRLLDEFLKSTFLEMFGDPVRNEKGWEIVKLKELVKCLDTGKSIQSVEIEAAGEFKVLKTSAVSWGNFIKEESKWLPLNYFPPKNHLIKKGDILMSRMNTCELVGASVFVFDEIKNLALPDRIWKFILNENNDINSYFLWYSINWSSFRKIISSISSGTSGSMKNITKIGVLNLQVIHPPLSLQTQFADIVKKTEILKERYQASLAELENLYQSLSQRAFRGELGVKEDPVLLAAEPGVGYFP